MEIIASSPAIQGTKSQDISAYAASIMTIKKNMYLVSCTTLWKHDADEEFLWDPNIVLLSNIKYS